MVAATKNSKKRKLFHKPIHDVGMGHFMSFLTTFCKSLQPWLLPRVLQFPHLMKFFLFLKWVPSFWLSPARNGDEVPAGAGLRSAQLSKPAILEPDGRLFF